TGSRKTGVKGPRGFAPRPPSAARGRPPPPAPPGPSCSTAATRTRSRRGRAPRTRACPKGGGPPRRSPGAPPRTPAPPTRRTSTIAIDDTSVYFTVDGPPATCVMRAPKAGGAVEKLACDPDGAWDIALDGDAVWWSNNGTKIVRLPKAGGAPEVRIDLEGKTT